MSIEKSNIFSIFRYIEKVNYQSTGIFMDISQQPRPVALFTFSWLENVLKALV